MKKISLIALIPSLIAPVSVMAAAGEVNLSYIMGYSTGFISIINDVLVPVLFSVAFLYFIYGVYKYFIAGATEAKSIEEGRQFILWSLIGFAAILSVWGLVNIVTTTFNLSPGGTPPKYPTL